jgi:hypothetical protein
VRLDDRLADALHGPGRQLDLPALPLVAAHGGLLSDCLTGSRRILTVSLGLREPALSLRSRVVRLPACPTRSWVPVPTPRSLVQLPGTIVMWATTPSSAALSPTLLTPAVA